MSLQKILVINTKYRIFGGEDANIVDELKFLKNHYEIDYLEYDNSKRVTISDFIGLITLSNPSSVSKLKNKIKTFNPDIVYVHNTWFKASLGIFKILKKENVKTIHKIHNYRFDCSRFIFSRNHLKGNKQCPACGINKDNLGIYNRYYPESLFKSLYLNYYSKKYFQIIKNNPIDILVLSNFQKKYIQKLGIKSEKIFIYPNPIQLSHKNFSNYNPKSKIVTFAGRLVETKGIEELLKIWTETETKNLTLEIIGAVESVGNKFKKYASKNIKFLGQLENDEVKRKIQLSRAVISATKLFEGQPRVLLEASSYSVPSIYPNFGGMSDFYPKDYSLSFNQYDYEDLKSKIMLLHDSNFLKVHSQEIRNHLIDNFSEEMLIKKFESILGCKEDE